MQATISFTLLLFIIISSAQTRSVDPIESDVETEISNEQNDKQLFTDQYSKLLSYLRNHKINTYQDDNTNTDDVASRDTKDVKPMSKRDFFLFPTRRSSQRYRPTYSYGRKSHWDTFFG